MKQINTTIDKKRNFIFCMEPDNKRLFKALAAKSELTMADILNDLVKNIIKEDVYVIEEE